MRPATTAADDIHRSTAELEAGLEHVRQSPSNGGRLELVVRRPAIGEREELAAGQLDLAEGLVGDTWSVRPSRASADGGPHAECQLNVMNSRMAALVAVDPGRRSLAGDQLYVDLDLSQENLPPGTRLAIGSAVIEVTARPHTGCDKFVSRFGRDAMRFVNSPIGRALRLRGLNARVVQGGTVRAGDAVHKVTP